MEIFSNLYGIIRKRASVLNSIHLNISFGSMLVGAILMSWLKLGSKVDNISLVEESDKFRWDVNKGAPTRAIFV